MGKRGPKPSGKTVVLSTRISPELRNVLLRSAKKGGRKIAAEVEFRLRRSFDEDARVDELFGGQQIYALLRMAAGAMTFVGNYALRLQPDGIQRWQNGESWLDDAYAYDQAFKAAIAVLESVRPMGDVAPPEIRRLNAEGIPAAVLDAIHADRVKQLDTVGENAAAAEISRIGAAPPKYPTRGKLSNRELSDRTIAFGLGELHNRIEGKRGK